MRLTEPYAVADIFVCGLGRVEMLKGGNVRFTHFAEQMLDDGTVERIVVARIVMPVEAVAEARRMTNEAIVNLINRATDHEVVKLRASH